TYVVGLGQQHLGRLNTHLGAVNTLRPRIWIRRPACGLLASKRLLVAGIGFVRGAFPAPLGPRMVWSSVFLLRSLALSLCGCPCRRPPRPGRDRSLPSGISIASNFHHESTALRPRSLRRCVVCRLR